MKRFVSFGALVGMTLGGALPMVWGDNNLFGVASLLLAMVGGFAGIFVAVWLGKQFG